RRLRHVARGRALLRHGRQGDRRGDRPLLPRPLPAGGQVQPRRRVPAGAEPRQGSRLVPEPRVRHARQLHHAHQGQPVAAPAARLPPGPAAAKAAGSYPEPRCAMAATIPRPTNAHPSLRQHGDVETLSHEFGHVLHQNLGRTEFARFSGTNTERDFVEAPSQIMEHWVWRVDVLQRFARHFETGDPIPEELVNQLVAARNLNKGIFQLRQMQYGWWDQELHAGPDRDLDEIYVKGTEVSLLPPH